MIVGFLHFLQHEKRYSPHTLEAYRRDLAQFEQHLGNEPATVAATHHQIRAWILALSKQGMAATSINRKLATLRTFFNWLLRQQAIKVNPMLRIRALNTPQRLPSFVPEPQMEQMFEQPAPEAFTEMRDRMVLELFYGTGMRLSELIGIKHLDINLQQGTILVVGKRNKQRMLPLTRAVCQLLPVYLEKKQELFGKSSPGCYLIVTNTGQQAYPVFIQRLVKKHLTMATTLEKRSPHVLRHTAATHLLQNGGSLRAIQELLGHSSLAATQVYTHTSLESLKDAYSLHPKFHPDE